MARIFYIQLRPAEEGLTVDITASPTIWQEVAEKGGSWKFRAADDVLIYVTGHTFELPADSLVEIAQVRTIRGTEEAELPQWADLQFRSWDNAKRAFVDTTSPR